jgi:GntR family transcriptional regulator / MocR family aminotransferase
MALAVLFDDLELLIHLDRSAEQSLRDQLIEQLRQAILKGQLAPGRRLPSTRSLARLLGISRNVAIAAYDELFVDGYVLRRTGSGTCVNTSLPLTRRFVELAREEVPQRQPHDDCTGSNSATCSITHPICFQLGASDISHLPLGIWRSIWKDVSSHLPPHWLHPTGDPDLRLAIAEYLGRARGLQCEADQIIVTASATQAIDLIARAFLKAGDRVGFEEPGYQWARQMLLARGASLVPFPVDLAGVRTDLLPGGSLVPSMAYITPSHQFPLGGRLPIERRVRLIEWATAHNALLIEDDYDSEFRFDAAPLPTLASLDRHGRVLYLGTFSKVLSPTLRLGYLVMPPALYRRLRHAILLPTDSPSWPLQQALLVCMREGHLERHVRRMRQVYAKKRALLKDLLNPISHLAHIHGLEAGLHVYLELHSQLDSTKLVQEAAKRGVILSTLDPFYLDRPDRNGLLLGYGALTHAEIRRGTTILVESIAALAEQAGL